jgi:hypothetical protein
MRVWILEEGKIDVNIWVNLDNNSLTIEIREQLPVFYNNKFTVFADRWGIQYIQKEENSRYKLISVIGGRRTEVEISEDEVKRIIRSVVKERIEEMLEALL